jgi:hypothetical protein
MTLTPPLLVAMAGGKPRLRRPRMPVPKEIILHVAVADLLRAHCLPDWRWTHINRTAKDARQGKILKTMGVNLGWFDFILISPARLPHFLDVKRIGENLSDSQEELRAWCFTWNIPAAIAWTMDDVLEVFDTWGCLRVVVPKRGASTS